MTTVRKSLSVLLLLLLTAAMLPASEAEVLSRLYRRVVSLEQKYDILQSLALVEDRSLDAFYTGVLDDLLYGDLFQYKGDAETEPIWDEMVLITVRELGRYKVLASAPMVNDVVDRSDDNALVRAEALIALGSMRAVEFAPAIAMRLRNLNFNTRSDKEAAEKEAYGAVVALDRMKEPVGFASVFYASIGWYSRRVTSVAERALADMMDDPTDQLAAIIRDASIYEHKIRALTVGQASRASTDANNRLAVVALAEGHRVTENDPGLRVAQGDLRKEAMRTLIANGSRNEDAIRYLELSARKGFDMDEKLLAIQALGVLGTDPAVTVLADMLSAYNERQMSGIAANNEELDLIRQIIFAMKLADNELAVESLTEIKYSDYTPALERQADEAIRSIQN